VPKPIFTPREAIELITTAGGVASLAHPATVGRDGLISELVEYGLVGLEAMHPKHDPARIHYYTKMAEDLGLIVTGGSDCHGRRPEGSVVGYGNVPATIVVALKNAQSDRRRN
jgi:predicted metal-dependent phosphoesterase TrpH